ncbi:hypothetical protein [Paraglaciecola sp. 20A4]|nr:hypothetical protein [Paraglaciecola sp. 20A4]
MDYASTSKGQISRIDTPYFIHNIHVVHFFEADQGCSNFIPD